MVCGRECQLLAYPFFTNRPMLALSWMATFTASLVAWGDPVTNQKVKAMDTEAYGISRKSTSK